MMELPLHPSVVHLPLALSFILPLLILGVILGERKGFANHKTWYFVVFFQLLLAASAWLAMQLGEDDAEKITAIIGEQIIHQHEERAENFVIGAWIVLGLSILPLLKLKFKIPELRMKLKFFVLFASSALLLLAFYVGRSGGELVYNHGAAQALSQTQIPLPDNSHAN